MGFERWFRRLSLQTELISSYLVILGIGGLATSILGSWIVSSTIMMQARRAVDHDFAATRTIYDQRLESLRIPVEFAASATLLSGHPAEREQGALLAYLGRVREQAGFDFLGLADARGRVILRVDGPARGMADLSSIGVLKAALAGKPAAATEVLSEATLAGENAALPERARFRVNGTGQVLGLSLVAAAPVRDARGEVSGVLYGGVLLSRNLAIVDQAGKLLFAGDARNGAATGAVTIYQGDLRVSTSLRLVNGERALGTRAPGEVSAAVLTSGQTWRGRAFVVDRWYISEYHPLRDYQGRIVGMLAVGLEENSYTSIRDRVILSFFGLATIGFILIIATTYRMIRNITRPLGEMVAVARGITAGRLDQEVRTDSPGEVALLAASFNAMLKSLRQMKGDLEEWGRTLEQKVRQRTEELGAMQARVAQSERLASLGMLAAGVAHEVNNPLGGILSLTALTLEDMPAADPNRENLEEVIRQTARCRDIVRRLLEFSRQSKGNTELVDLNRILQDTLALVSKQAQFFNVEVIRDWEPGLPGVIADKSQFQQVFVNLLMNAAQAMDERGTLTIRTRSNASAHSVEVAISDTGHGIPPDHIGRIFDPFFTTKSSGQGTGLGLSITYGIVTTHGGAISVESQVAKGTTFTIRMPLAGVQQETQA